MSCSITVSNFGPSTAQSVSVDDDLPAGVTLTGPPGDGGFARGVGDPFSCTLPFLADGASATLTFSVLVSDVTPGSSLSNSATVSAATPDPGPRSNTSTATALVVQRTITGAGDTGTEGDDVIRGSAGPDRITGLGGNDVIFGLAVTTNSAGGDGNDVLLGGQGSNQLVGGNGNDQLLSGGGSVDRLSGGPGDDTLNTVDGSGDDYAVGGEHQADDTCIGTLVIPSLCVSDKREQARIPAGHPLLLTLCQLSYRFLRPVPAAY